MASPLLDLLRAPDQGAVDALLAGAVRFRSPVADYEGRADVSHLLSLIATVVQGVEPAREFGEGAARATFFSGRVEGRLVQGVLDERYDEDGLLIDATLMLRPFAALRIAIVAMAAALEAAPLPSAR